ncbi:extracellular solute-binding protein [Acinetobacter sp. CAAS 2-6]|uniref:extracellular solute-binding protein n=1 Tax=Acinetobacter sp. CAAS 2-6 TaxID=3016358 RepID=UPI002DD62627|nr:extracellular solute-binding protein [Acinetobacter sp. CAAS 2-6]
MRQFYTRVPSLALVFGLSMLAQGVSAALQTTPYIALHTQPRYSGLAALPYANPKAPKGGLLSTASMGTFDNLNSMNGKGSSTEGVNYLFDSLMDSSLDEPGVLYPLLAEKVTFDPEKTKFVIFHLNPKAHFSNGQPLTAQDVKFTFDTYQSKANPGLQMYISDLAKTEVLSKYQVKFHFKSDNNSEMPLILATLPIYSKQDWQGKDFSRISMQPILGSGPYVIDRIDAGRSITYKRNPNYWGKDLIINRGRYNFDKIKYVYYRNLDIAFEGFKSGQYTLHEEMTARKWVTEYRFPAVTAGMVKKYRFQHHNPIATQSFIFNTRRSPFQDIRLRQALTYAYDFEWQNKALFYGQYRRLQSYFSNSELEARGTPSAAEMQILKPLLPGLPPLQRQGVMLNWKYPVSDASGFNRNNLLVARQMLLDAGYPIRGGQLYDRQGKPIQIEFLIHQDGLQRTLMPFVRNLKKLGIMVNIRQVDLPQYIERMRRFDFDMTTGVMPQSLTPGNEQAQLWGSAAADQVGNFNYAGIKSPAIDQVVQSVIRAPNRQQLVIRTRVLDRLLRAGYYQIPTYGKGENWLAYWNMYRQPQIKPKLSTGIDYWWVDAAQAQKVNQYLRQQ